MLAGAAKTGTLGARLEKFAATVAAATSSELESKASATDVASATQPSGLINSACKRSSWRINNTRPTTGVVCGKWKRNIHIQCTSCNNRLHFKGARGRRHWHSPPQRRQVLALRQAHESELQQRRRAQQRRGRRVITGGQNQRAKTSSPALELLQAKARSNVHVQTIISNSDSSNGIRATSSLTQKRCVGASPRS